MEGVVFPRCSYKEFEQGLWFGENLNAVQVSWTHDGVQAALGPSRSLVTLKFLCALFPFGQFIYSRASHGTLYIKLLPDDIVCLRACIP